MWDCFLLEGEIFAFVASLGMSPLPLPTSSPSPSLLEHSSPISLVNSCLIGILRLYRKSLKRMDMEECKKMLSNLPIVCTLSLSYYTTTMVLIFLFFTSFSFLFFYLSSLLFPSLLFSFSPSPLLPFSPSLSPIPSLHSFCPSLLLSFSTLFFFYTGHSRRRAVHIN